MKLEEYTFKELFPISLMQFEDKQLALEALPFASKVLKNKENINFNYSKSAGPNSAITLNKTNSCTAGISLLKINVKLCEYCKEYLRHVGMSDSISHSKSSIYFNNLGLYGTQHSHVHDLSPVTGVLYLDVDPDSAPLVIENPNTLNFYVFGSQIKEEKLVNTHDVATEPYNGLGLIFPGWLKHFVPTNYTNKRIVLTFVYYYL